MSVATKNPFALLDADESAPASNAGTVSTPAPAAPTPAATRGGANKPRGGPAARGGKYYSRGGGAKPAAAGASEETPAGGERPKRNFDGEGRGRGGGRGGRGRGGPRGARGAGGGGGGGGGGGRLDRHSGTGKVDSEKKVSQGWGGEDGNAELKAEEGATADATAEGDAWGAEAAAADDAWGGAATTGGDDPWAAPNASDEPAAAADDGKAEARRAREREQEEEDNTLTLDQYLAQKAEKEASLVPKLEGVRQANEGGDDSLWKDAVQLQKGDDEDAYFVGKPKSAPKARTKKEEKVYIEIDTRFDRPERPGRGGRGGRGGDRGRGDRPPRGRGGARGGRANGGQVVNVDDEKAFPSLS